MNSDLFLWLYNLAHSSEAFATAAIWFARSAQYIVLGGMLAFLFTEFEHHKKVFQEALILASTGVAAWLVAVIIKVSVHAPRPFLAMPYIDPLFVYGGHNSFPSGHAAVFFALATAMYFYSKPIGILFFIIAFLISVGRVMAGIHFPIDILVGAILGIVIAYALHRFTPLFSKAKKRKKVK